ESDLSDEQVLFLSDIFQTGYMGADMAVRPGDTVAVWGAGPVGMLAAASANLLGAARVIVVDRFDYRLRRAAERTGADTVDYAGVGVVDALNEMTAGRGPDACIAAVGLEAHHGNPLVHAYDRVKQATRQQTERGAAVREAILAFRTGQCHVQRYLRPLLTRIEAGEIDPSFVISHRMPLEDAAKGYEIFKNKQDDCTKVVLKP